MSAFIRFDRVSKKFTLYHKRARSFQELALDLFRVGSRSREEFWALRDVSFTVEQGETVGLIGSNGAGKSTALKIISRIIEPTAGRSQVGGRVGALLELGAGFHPDLTGRENVYMNAAILGLSRTQIRRKLDEIVCFAELEQFIDMPVKHYSSGMYVRLGFAVAVQTDPEVLLVDEVLAVGDAAFQRKCLDRIDHMRRQGVTVLFVSHHAEMVRSICSRVLWLDSGQLVADDSADTVMARYLAHSWAPGEACLGPGKTSERRWGSGEVRIVGLRLLDGAGREQQQFRVGEPLTVEMRYRTTKRVELPVFGLAIHRSDGVRITGPNTQFAGCDIPCIEREGVVRYAVPHMPLLEGTYYVSVAAHSQDDSEMYDYHHQLYLFRVLPSEGEQYGIVTFNGQWSWREGVN